MGLLNARRAHRAVPKCPRTIRVNLCDWFFIQPVHWNPCFPKPLQKYKKNLLYCKNFKPKILPYKIFTMTAKCWMLEKSWDELVAFNFRNIFFLECPFSGSCFCWKRCCFLKKLSAINRDGKRIFEILIADVGGN